MNKKVDRAILGITFIFPLLIAIVVGGMIYPSTVIDIQNFEVYEAVGGDRQLKQYQVKAGDDLEFEVKFKKFKDATATVTVLLKQINNGYLYPYAETKTTRMPVGQWHYKSSVLIPKATPPGKYVIIRTYRYYVNFLRTVDVEIVSNQFEVIR